MCHQQLGPHNTKHRHTNQSAKHHTTTHIFATINIRSDYRLQKTANIYRLQESRLDKISRRHRVRFLSYHNAHQHTYCQYNFKDIILMAEKHNIPTCKMHSYCRLLLDHILCRIRQRDNMRRANTCDLTLNLLIEEITSDKHKHTYGRNIWMRTLRSQAQHTHVLEDNTRYIQ